MICPEKVSVSEWVDIVKTAHEVGIPGSATIMYGHVETLEERVEHIDIIRQIQEDTHGFTVSNSDKNGYYSYSFYSTDKNLVAEMAKRFK